MLSTAPVNGLGELILDKRMPAQGGLWSSLPYLLGRRMLTDQNPESHASALLVHP